MSSILFISPFPTHPANNGTRVRTCSLLAQLQSFGHQVHYLHIDRASSDRTAMDAAWDTVVDVPFVKPRRTVAEKIFRITGLYDQCYPVRPLNIDAWYHDSYDGPIKDAIRDFNVTIVIAHYVFLSRALTLADSGILKIIDTHNVFSDRHKAFTKRGMRPTFFYTSKAQEKIGLDRADLILAIQDNERDFLSQLTAKPVVTVGHIFDIAAESEVPDRASGTRLLFVGSDNPMNVDAIRYFTHDVLPLLRESLPGIHITIAGGVCDRLDCLPAECVAVGFVEQLAEQYQASDIVINPCQFGTGLKIKNIEAMAHGKPLVTTTVGADGLEDGVGSAFLCADSAQDFADCITRLLRDHELYSQVARQATAYVQRCNTRNVGVLNESILKYQRDPGGVM